MFNWSAIPRPALTLGFAGTLPFLFAALAPLDVTDRYVLSLAYGLVILCFMAGTLWGFAARRSDAFGYAASVIPAILAFGLLTDHVLSLGLGTITRHWLLIALFIGLLPLDHWMQKQGLAPPWWLSLRLSITAVVLACLIFVGLQPIP